eukprot:CAMPEP_0172632554 /NCGR_PEP_ID=MMETSP1068-20121228/185042_1 /TAXON_ID=35684 /ORGANISM="Pseudopedinella elastica, Strain CCMP716" /LENGTH=132 /DNA_ID=CAMNT_0013444003 /DNA_START=354 /DNA_END=753 /DNA_ORIENTATION=-
MRKLALERRQLLLELVLSKAPIKLELQQLIFKGRGQPLLFVDGPSEFGLGLCELVEQHALVTLDIRHHPLEAAAARFFSSPVALSAASFAALAAAFWAATFAIPTALALSSSLTFSIAPARPFESGAILAAL